MSKSKLGNPALLVAAQSPAAQKAVDKATDVIPFFLKIVVAAGAGYIIYRLITNRFTKKDEISAYGAANVTYAQAAAKAEALYSAMYGLGNGFEQVKEALRVGNSGLNYNGYIRVYNAFGARETFTSIPVINPIKMNLTDWIVDQFNEAEKAELRFIVNGFF